MQKIERRILTVDVMYFKHVCVYCMPIILYVMLRIIFRLSYDCKILDL